MPRKYPYLPAFDNKKAQPGTEWLANACVRRWKCRVGGIYAFRLMRNSHTKNLKVGDPGWEKWLTVHATGAAADIHYPNETVAREMWDWFLGSSVIDGKEVQHSAHLGICEIHWYAFGKFGAGYRCSRGEGKSGVVVYKSAEESAGSFDGNPDWLHIELSPEMAKDAARFELAWRSLPKPGAAPAA